MDSHCARPDAMRRPRARPGPGLSEDEQLVAGLSRACVLVLGDVMLDRYIYGSVERMSPEAPVPVLRQVSQRAMAGGAGNVARNIAALGSTVLLIGLIGEDPAGRELVTMLEQEHRVTARLIADPARPTTLKTRFVAGHQQLLRVDDEAKRPATGATAAALLSALGAGLRSVDVVVFSDYAKGVLSDAVLMPAIAMVRQAGKRLLVDPKSRDFRRYAGAHVLKPNRRELSAATGITGSDDASIVDAARKTIATAGVEAVLATRGERGMTLVVPRGEPLHIPAEAREVFDVSGAGDTVIATLAVALGAGADLTRAARLANMAAGISSSKFGTAVVHPADLLSAISARAALGEPKGVSPGTSREDPQNGCASQRWGTESRGVPSA